MVHEQLSIHPARFVASLSSYFAGVETQAQLDALSTREAFLRYLDVQDSFAQMSRLRTAAYAHAQLPVPADHLFERPRAEFMVEREEPLTAVDVRVAFSDAGEPPVVGEWIARRQTDGSWRLVVPHQLCTPPGVQVWIMDDPVVLEYIRPYMDSDTPAV